MAVADYPFLAELGLKDHNDGVYYGKWAANGPVVQSLDPSTGKVIASVREVRLCCMNVCLSVSLSVSVSVSLCSCPCLCVCVAQPVPRTPTFLTRFRALSRTTTPP